jgi:hypothetical protein
MSYKDDIERIKAGATSLVEDGQHPADRLTRTDQREMYDWIIAVLAEIPVCPKCGENACKENVITFMHRANQALVGPTSMLMCLMALLRRVGPVVDVTADELEVLFNMDPPGGLHYEVLEAEGVVRMKFFQGFEDAPPQEGQEEGGDVDMWPSIVDDKNEGPVM